MKKLIATILISCSFSLVINAQILPPTFLCVKGDTLFWELPNNSCGSFVSYDVFTSNDINGPFTLLSSVTDPSQAFLYDPNPAGLLIYYYLLSNYACPGQTQVPSDTLDSRPPVVSPLINISVQGTDVVLNWQQSPSPEVYGYIVYRRDAVGVIPIDTVFNGITEYTDPNAEPDVESEGYFVNALDRCGNTSIFDAEHKTVFLEATATNCSIDLSWNTYQGWSAIGAQEIWVSENGGASAIHEVLDGATDFYSFRQVNDGASYCFYIRSVESGGVGASQSNQVCLSASFSQPVNELYIFNIDVLPDNSVAIDWGINANADVETLEFMRGNDQGVFTNVEILMPTAAFPTTNQYQDATADAGAGPISFQLHAVDSCDNELISPQAISIHLSGSTQGTGGSFLVWTPLIINNLTVSNYEVIRIANGMETSIGTVGNGQLDYEDNFDPLSVGSGTVCYRIVATGSVILPDGTGRAITSRSNIFCLDQAIRIFVPNALAPAGYNKDFKPVILAGNIAKYEMEIFDRFGSIVFFTDNPDEAWQGKKDGEKLPQGVYAYRIFLELENGNKEEKKGYVVLLR